MATYLHLSECPPDALKNLPYDMEIRGSLSFFDCKTLAVLPKELKVEKDLLLEGFKSLEYLPKGLIVGRELNLKWCEKLTSIPEDLQVGEKIIINYLEDGGTGVWIKQFPERLHSKIEWESSNHS